jgi:hypothetical protein
VTCVRCSAVGPAAINPAPAGRPGGCRASILAAGSGQDASDANQRLFAVEVGSVIPDHGQSERVGPTAYGVGWNVIPFAVDPHTIVVGHRVLDRLGFPPVGGRTRANLEMVLQCACLLLDISRDGAELTVIANRGARVGGQRIDGRRVAPDFIALWRLDDLWTGDVASLYRSQAVLGPRVDDVGVSWRSGVIDNAVVMRFPKSRVAGMVVRRAYTHNHRCRLLANDVSTRHG